MSHENTNIGQRFYILFETFEHLLLGASNDVVPLPTKVRDHFPTAVVFTNYRYRTLLFTQLLLLHLVCETLSPTRHYPLMQTLIFTRKRGQRLKLENVLTILQFSERLKRYEKFEQCPGQETST